MALSLQNRMKFCPPPQIRPKRPKSMLFSGWIRLLS
jgi:hypothetical protein